MHVKNADPDLLILKEASWSGSMWVEKFEKVRCTLCTYFVEYGNVLRKIIPTLPTNVFVTFLQTRTKLDSCNSVGGSRCGVVDKRMPCKPGVAGSIPGITSLSDETLSRGPISN